MSDNPLFSVLIANYNNGRFLMEAVDSVKAQTYPSWEIVLVDDDSTDNSHELYKQLEQDDRIHIFYNGENKGCGYTKCRCAELAKGEICGFLDPDDALGNDEAIKLMVEKHLLEPKASLVYSDMFSVDFDMTIKDIIRHENISTGSSILGTCSWPIGHWCTFKKESYSKTEGIDSFMERAVDMDMYYKLEEVGEVIHIDLPLYKYRVTPLSISMNANMYKAHAWHTYACVQAIKRRGCRDEKLILFPLEYDIKEAYSKGLEMGENKIRNTWAYKVGKFIIRPFSWIIK